MGNERPFTRFYSEPFKEETTAVHTGGWKYNVISVLTKKNAQIRMEFNWFGTIPLTDSWEYDNETSGYIIGGSFFDKLNKCQLLYEEFYFMEEVIDQGISWWGWNRSLAPIF